jgi:regulator of sigma E protease
MSMSGLAFTAPSIQIPKYDLITAVGKGIQTNWFILEMVAKVLRRLITREVSPKFLTGPIGIVNATSRVVQIGVMSLLFFVGFISVNLGIVNLLPIPIADGGQILFFTLEKLRGKPLSLRKQTIIQQVSIVLIAGLFLYITFYDLLRVFFV